MNQEAKERADRRLNPNNGSRCRLTNPITRMTIDQFWPEREFLI